MQAPRQSRQALSTDAVVDTALQVADAAGIGAVSLRTLASRFGVTPMALYRHVRDKDHLLDLMAGRLLDELDLGSGDELPWQEELRRLGDSFLALVATHPAAPFLLSRPFDSPGARRVSGALMRILDRAGFPRGDAFQLLPALTGMLLGPAIHRATYASAAARASSSGRSEWSGTRAGAEGQAEGNSDLEAGWAGPDADRLVVELWVAAVQGLAADRSRIAFDPT